MLKVLINGIFWLITKLANIIISPFVIGISALFPDMANVFGYISQFLEKAITYVPFLIDFLLIPRTAITLLFDFLLIKYSIFLLKCTINFAVNIYNKFKI